MKKFAAILAAMCITAPAMAQVQPQQFNLVCQAQVAFSPNGAGEQLVLNAVNASTDQILVQAYNFTNSAILQALLAAKKRGVDVRLILDESNEQDRYKGLIQPFLALSIPVYTDFKPAIAHNKVMVIDKQTVITGSYNFTKSAQKSNAENLLVLKGCTGLTQQYMQNWNNRLAVSRPYGTK